MATSKTSHLGRAGHLAAMAEFLLRGYNAAIPEVDVGDDVFVVDDGTGTLWRVQVKTAVPQESKGVVSAQFKFSAAQLRKAHRVELTYVLVLRREDRWTFLVIPRAKLFEIRTEFENETGNTVTGDDLVMRFVLEGEDVRCWERPFQSYINNWETFPELPTGPGARRAADPSPRPRTESRPDPGPPEEKDR